MVELESGGRVFGQYILSECQRSLAPWLPEKSIGVMSSAWVGNLRSAAVFGPAREHVVTIDIFSGKSF